MVPSSDVQNLHPDVLRIMRDCIVVRAEMLFERQCIRYTAICAQFEESLRYQMPPEYVYEVDNSVDMNGRVTWKRR